MIPKKRLGEMLIEAGIIDETQLKAALGHQRQWGVRLGQALVDLKLATEADVVRALAVKFGFPVARLDALEPYGLEQALKLFPREFAFRNNVFPMAADTAVVTVAMSDPTNLAVVDEIRFRTGRRVKVCIGGDREVADALKRHYPGATEVEAIALDLDADLGQTEALYDPFGGGSKDALEAFFGNADPAPQAAFAQAAVSPAPAPAPVAAPVAAQPAAAPQRSAAVPAPRPRPAAQPSQPALAAPPAQAAVRAQPAAAARAPAPVVAVPSPAAVAPAAVAGPAPARAAAAPAPSARPAAPAAAPVAAAPAPAVAAPAQKARSFELELELGPFPGGGSAPGGEPILATDLAPEEEMVEGRAPSRALTAKEIAILDALDRLAGGAHAEPEIVKPTQAIASLVRLLLRKRIITEQELLDELARK